MTVIFVSGGPGAGKGTQCAKLEQDFPIHHLSVGDILRAERDRPNSEYRRIIADNMKHGRVGPMEITVELLKSAMEQALIESDKDLFLIDGRFLTPIKFFE